MEECVSFDNQSGERLFGIVHHPEPLARAVGPWPVAAICLNTGMQYRTIWHRLNVKIARRLCAAGVPVLRFDTHGIGDSEGEFFLPDATGFSPYHDRIQGGYFVPDTIAAAEYFRKRVDCERLVLLGPCGGALTGMTAAARSAEVDALVYMAGPVTITSSELTLAMHPRDAEIAVRNLRHKLLHPRSWFHFLTGQSDYLEIWRALRIHLRQRLNRESLFVAPRKPAADEGKTPPPAGNGEAESGLVFNEVFLESFLAFMRRGGRVLFLMPEKDRSSWGFREMFENRCLQPGHPWPGQVEVRYIGDANHIYQEIHSQRELLERIEAFFAVLASPVTAAGAGP
jgi:pimeloyl-ACP methyl ester carboxylesterase